MCLGHFARKHGIPFDRKQGKARVGSGVVANTKVVLARPQTYMNLSGDSVSRLVRRYEVSLDDLLVVHDDLDLPLGKLRIRRDGGSGGHKGIESIVSALGSQDFLRLRVGIGLPYSAQGSTEVSDADVVDYVLGDFNPEQKRVIDAVIPTVGEAIYCLLTEDWQAAMNKYN
jgi:PTH1 family peptidyl-tRNA hydrolase